LEQIEETWKTDARHQRERIDHLEEENHRLNLIIRDKIVDATLQAGITLQSVLPVLTNVQAFYTICTHRGLLAKLFNLTIMPLRSVCPSISDKTSNGVGWQRGSAVEHQSLASVLSPFCARPLPDG